MTKADKWLRLALGATALFCLAAAGAYAAAYAGTAATLRHALLRPAGARPDGGQAVLISAAAFSTRGFPFFLRGAARDVTVSGGRLRYAAPTVFVDALPIAPTRVVLTAPELQLLDLGRLGKFRIETKGARASIGAGRNGEARPKTSKDWRLDAQADELTATSEDGQIRLGAKGLLVKTAPAGARGWRASLFAGAVDWTQNDHHASAEKLLLDAAAAVKGAVVEIDLKRLELQAGASTVAPKGPLTVGEDGELRGVLTARIADPADFTRFLAALGALDEKDADRAAAALTFVALGPGGVVEAPIELKDGAARIAGVKIAKLPKLRRLAP